MKRRTPYDRDNLHIKKRDWVLEVGPGHNPSHRANVVTEKFTDQNYHRCGDMKIYPHQPSVGTCRESRKIYQRTMPGSIPGIHGNSQPVGGISISEEIAPMDYTGYRQ